MGRIYKNEAVFEQLALRDSKKWSYTAMIMISDSDKIRISSVRCF